jgi:hypothetical protein
VHLLHITFTHVVGRHSSQVIVQTLLVCLCFDFSTGMNRPTNLHFKTFDYRYVLFFPFMSLL